jgi:surface polysaccharide O-acyltransferase-like enzyme
MACSFSAERLGKRVCPVLSKVARLTFGVYLIHIFIMRYVLWHCDYILGIQSYILQTIVIIILTLAGSFILSWLISLLPFSNYIIGYQKKRNGFDHKQNII